MSHSIWINATHIEVLNCTRPEQRCPGLITDYDALFLNNWRKDLVNSVILCNRAVREDCSFFLNLKILLSIMNFDLIGNTGQVLILMNQNLDYIIGCENR